MDASIPGIIRANANQRPDSLAILSINRSPLTYGRLHEHTSTIIAILNGIDISREDRVAIVVPNGPEMATAFLTISSGATSVPLNPAFKRSEFESYLTDLEISAVVVQTGLDSPVREIAQERQIPILDLHPDSDVSGVFSLTLNGETLSSENLGAPVYSRPDDIASILFTSGTTSQPKKVGLRHFHLNEACEIKTRILSLTEKDRCLNVMPYFHVHGLKVCLLDSLKAGGSMFCTNGFSPSSFFDYLAQSRATWYSAVPTIHQTILARAKAANLVVDGHQLRFIRSTSAALAPSELEKLEDLFNVPVIETYGLTEISHWITCNPLPRMKRKLGSVGCSAGPDIAIMDSSDSLLGVNETDEIVVRGDTLECGYLDNDEANEKAFIDGWFRTGDLGYLDEDGYLFITGRLKEVINRGGEIISPKEIDDVLLRHPAVQQATTFALPDDLVGEDVAAAIVLAENQTVDDRDLQEFCSRYLVDSKVPRRIVFLKEIPKGPTGKILRIGLADYLGITSGLDGDLRERFEENQDDQIEKPQTLTEERLSEIWLRVLGLSKLGVTQDFIAVGGDSIQVGQIRTRVEDEFGVELSFIDFFGSPTIRKLSCVIDELIQERQAAKRPSLSRSIRPNTDTKDSRMIA